MIWVLYTCSVISSLIMLWSRKLMGEPYTGNLYVRFYEGVRVNASPYSIALSERSERAFTLSMISYSPPNVIGKIQVYPRFVMATPVNKTSGHPSRKTPMSSLSIYPSHTLRPDSLTAHTSQWNLKSRFVIDFLLIEGA